MFTIKLNCLTGTLQFKPAIENMEMSLKYDIFIAYLLGFAPKYNSNVTHLLCPIKQLTNNEVCPLELQSSTWILWPKKQSTKGWWSHCNKYWYYLLDNIDWIFLCFPSDTYRKSCVLKTSLLFTLPNDTMLLCCIVIYYCKKIVWLYWNNETYI